MKILQKKAQGGILFVALLLLLTAVAAILASRVVGFGFPLFRARVTAAPNACVNNLRQIDGAKAQLALEHQLTNGTPVRPTQVGLYLKGGVLPQCPEGGTYTVGKIGENPTCSIGTGQHVLPP